MKGRPTDFSPVVAQHWAKSKAYVLASRQPCLRIRDDEVKHIGKNRNLVPLEPDALGRIDLEVVWVLGVILCPGDTVTGLANWVKANRIDPGHVWFFLHSSTDMAVLQPWADAGFPTDQVDMVEDWGELHSVFGLYLSDYIYEVHGPPHAQRWTPGRRLK